MGNPVVHFEIAGPDGPALQQFYRDLFGWNVQAQGGEMGNYGLAQANEGGIGGGIMETTDDMPASNYVTFYIQVDDLQAALDKLSGMGGTAVVPPTEIAPGMGSFAMFTDPAHNAIGLYSLPHEWDGEMPPKGNAPPVVHFEVGGSDAEALNDFYTGTFGWRTTLMQAMNYRLVAQEPEGIGGGIFQHRADMPPNAPSVAVMVDDLQAYLDKAVSLGATALMQPNEIPGGFGSLAIFTDIAGNRISLFKAPEDPAGPQD
ncbi:MAG: VOC family protein [Candidatus Latescibacteria bacterium]|nr:VOC family protein [Candidatus Latescibacterota bacterium]